MSIQKKLKEEKELREGVILIDQVIPINVLMIMLTDTHAAFVHPDRLALAFKNAGLDDMSEKIIRIMGRTGFWEALVGQCFPRVNKLPLYMEIKLQFGDVYHNENVRWGNVWYYILSIFKHVRVEIYTGTWFDSYGIWNPPLHIKPHTLTTCAEYTLSPHIITHEYNVDVPEQAPFLFMISLVEPTDEVLGFDQLAKLYVELLSEDIPTVGDLGNDVELDNSPIGNLHDAITGGVSVFKNNIPVQFPFNDAIKVDYDIRWTTNNNANKFRNVIPQMRVKIHLRLKFWPGRINNHILYAIDMRRGGTRIFPSERLPLRIDLYDGIFSPPLKVKSLLLTVEDDLDIFPGLRDVALDATGAYDSLVSKIYTMIQAEPEPEIYETMRNDPEQPYIPMQLYGAMFESFATNDYKLEIPHDWNSDGIYGTIVLSPPRNYSSHMYIGEIVGPPRPFRPVDSDELHYKLFEDERRRSHIVIKMTTSVNL